MAVNYFILVYHLGDGHVDVEPFQSDMDGADERYRQLEAQLREDAHREVVLVGADSIETIKRTHSHYFVEESHDLFDRLVSQLLDDFPAAPPRGR